jgi:phage portal protein BeeE
MRFVFSVIGNAWRMTGLRQSVGHGDGTSSTYNPDPAGKTNKITDMIGWAFSAIHRKATFGAMVPMGFYSIPRGGTEQDKEALAYDHPACVTWRNVNSQDVNYTLKESLISYMNLAGYAFLMKVGPGTPYRGPAQELTVMKPDDVKEIVRDDQGRIHHYLVGQGRKHVPANQIIYLPSFDAGGGWGQSPVKAVGKALTSEIYAQDWNNNFLKNMAMPGVLFKRTKKGAIGLKQKEVLVKTWDAWHKGPAAAGGTAILPADVEVLLQSMPHKDMLWPELRKMNREEIFGALGTNSAVMGLDVADRSRFEGAMRAFAEYVMKPEMTPIEQYLSQSWLTEYKDENLICRWDWSQVPALRDDENAKLERAGKAVTNRLMSPNRARAVYLNLEGYEGGDTIYAPLNLIPIAEDAHKPRAARGGPNARGDKPVYEDWQLKRLAVYGRRLDSCQKPVERIFEQMFKDQRKAVMSAFERSWDCYKGRSNATKAVAITKRDLNDLWAELDTMLSEISAVPTKQALSLAVETGIEHGLEGLGGVGPATFSLEQSPYLLDWLDTTATMHAKLIDGTTLKQMARAKDVIYDMMAEGALTKDIENVLDDVFMHRRRNVASIARTEVQSGVQNGQIGTWRDSGVVEGKTWLASQHPEGRHNDMHNQTVAIDGQFVGEAGVADGPGMFGDPAQDINCLCDMAPKVSLKMAVAGHMQYWDRVLGLEGQGGKGSMAWRKKRVASAT